jgi:hypothetical protein
VTGSATSRPTPPPAADGGPQRTALVPAFTAWARLLPAIKQLALPARDWFLDGYARLGPLTVAAGFVVCDHGPLADLTVLDQPAHVVHRG